jgi:hypothetical protein
MAALAAACSNAERGSVAAGPSVENNPEVATSSVTSEVEEPRLRRSRRHRRRLINRALSSAESVDQGTVRVSPRQRSTSA